MRKLISTAMLVGLVGFLAGYAVRTWHQQSIDRKWALNNYQNLTLHGEPLDTHQLELCRESLRDKLLEDLGQPYETQAEGDDRWGRAFYVMNNNRRPFSLRFAEGMSREDQDDRIRYLCFVIENEARGRRFLYFESHGFDKAPRTGEDACRFLAGYPDEALNRNSDRIRAAIWRAFLEYRLTGNRPHLAMVAGALAAAQTDQDWGFQLCYKLVEYNALATIADPYETLLHLLKDQSQGDRNFILDRGADQPKPSEKLRTRSRALVEKLRADFQGGVIRLGDQKKPVVDKWLGELTVQSRPEQ